jgi:hypothetical protein
VLAEEILAGVDEAAVWRELVSAGDLRIRLDALKYLTDRRDGKAPQAVPATPALEGPLRIYKAKWLREGEAKWAIDAEEPAAPGQSAYPLEGQRLARPARALL